VQHVKRAQAQPETTAPRIAVTPAAPQAAEPAPPKTSQPEAAPAQDVAAPTAPAPTPAPTVENPLPENPTPLVNAPSAEPSAPVVSAPPVEAPAPVVTAPSQPDKPAVADTNEKTAKQLFGAAKLPTLGKAMAIGYYPRGCLQGGVDLPITGPTWQVMRVSRNRNWGHPDLVRFLEKFAPRAAKATGWKGILVGDMAQPRGGPLPSDHMSHTTGLDVDIWFMPMPDHTLSKEERDKIAAINLVADDWKRLNPKTWTPQHAAFIKTAAEAPEVERVLVNAAIKQELCRVDPKASWMAKVRPWYGHHDHIHVRLSCPADSPNCRKQPAVAGSNGCEPDALKYWFSDKVLNPPKPTTTTPRKPPKPVMLADLPPACKNVLDAPAKTVKAGLP
jgi:penicillin-insensitive murein endopeptidase